MMPSLIPKAEQENIVLLLKKGRHTEAIDFLKQKLLESKSIESPTPSLIHAEYHNFLGFAYESCGQLKIAEFHYTESYHCAPKNPEYANNLAMVLFNQGKKILAQKYFEKLLILKPDASSFYNMSLFYSDLQRFPEAFEHLEKAAAIAPGWTEPQNHLYILIDSNLYASSTLETIQNALSHQPESAFYLTAMGIYYHLTNKNKLAVNYFKSAIQHDARYLETFRYLINSLHSDKNYGNALSWSLRLYQSEQSFESGKEILASLQEPVVKSLQEIQDINNNLHTFLDEAIQTKAYPPIPLNKVQFSRQLNFYHSYQNKIDLPLQKKLAQFYRLPIADFPFKGTPNKKRRVGIISMHAHNHSVMHLLQRAVEHVLKDKDLETYLYTPEVQRANFDQVTQSLTQSANHFRILPIHYGTSLEVIARDNLDVLIYTDLGMDSITYELALQRLAKVQLTMSGHPVTTGASTVDYFISSDVLETEAGQTHYSEQLIKLKGLPDYCPVTATEIKKKEDLGLPEGNLYFCPMTLFKVHPEFDNVIKAILEKDPLAQVLFLQYKSNLHQKLQHRFASKIESADRIHFLNWSSQAIFHQRLMAANVLLDSFYFGGGNTAYQALGMGCPIVTLDLPWNKSRWTQAMYRLMETPELITTSISDYAKKAVEVATNQSYNQLLRNRLKQKSSILFNNDTWSEALLHFCKTLSLPSI